MSGRLQFYHLRQNWKADIVHQAFLAENENDREFKRKMVETVVDMEKISREIYASPLLSEAMRDFLDNKKTWLRV